MANTTSATFAILLLLAIAMATPQTASSFSFGGSNLFRCWKALTSFEGCVTRVEVPVALNIQLKLTEQCCNSLEEIRENCFPTIYSTFSFAPNLGSLFQGLCGDYSAPAPQPATVA